MSSAPVHWEEGMFLRPHHFQAAERHRIEAGRDQTGLTQPYFWGLAKFDLDAEALNGFRLVVRSLLVRFRDGSVIRLPEDGGEIGFDLNPIFKAVSRAKILLAVAQVRLGQDNILKEGNPSARYTVAMQDVEDENMGGNPQPITIKRLAFRLLTDQDNALGYETIPLCQLRKNEQGLPELDKSYVPPLLACESYPILYQGILRDLQSRIQARLEGLTTFMRDRGIELESHSAGDARRIWQLARLNEAVAVLDQDVTVPGIHPLMVYREMCRIVGQLAIFSPEKRCPSLPLYSHDDLFKCFNTVKLQILALLDDVPRPTFEQRAFSGIGLRMQVAIEPRWLEPAWQIFLGVRSSLGGEEIVKMLTRPERLGMKIGSSERVDLIFTRGAAGLKFSHAPTPPRDLPKAGNLVYFEVTRDNESEWQFVIQSLTLAVRLRETDIVGDISGQEKLTFLIGGRNTVEIEIVLYLVPRSADMLKTA